VHIFISDEEMLTAEFSRRIIGLFSIFGQILEITWNRKAACSFDELAL
jgi:hypothetical protein